MEFKNELSEEEISQIKQMIEEEAKKKLMTHHSEAELREAFSRGDALAAFAGPEVVGHVSLLHWERYVEVAALVIKESHRQKGIGRTLFGRISQLAEEKYPAKQVIVLANGISSQIAAHCGFVPEEKDNFDQDVWKLCSQCEEFGHFPDCHCLPMIRKGICIVKLGAQDHPLIKGVAEEYCKIWQEPPWCEDFWTVEAVMENIAEHLGKTKAIALVALKGERVVGFSWGSALKKKELAVVSSGAELDQIFGRQEEIFYVNETGVSKTARKGGIGMLLTQALIKEAKKEKAMENFCLRTDEKAIAARRLYEKVGFCDLGIRDKKHIFRTYWLL